MASKDHGLTPIELSSFCSEIALMLGAGMPLYAGMEALEKTYEDDAHAALYRGVSETLTQTGSLRDALESAHAFPTYLVEMCGVGERTGHLEDVMRGLSVYYERESRIRQAVRSAVTYPLVLAVMMIIAVLAVFDIPYAAYNAGGSLINLFLGPATVCLAVTIYAQIDLLKKNLLPILAGCAAGAVTSVLSIWGLCRLFGLDRTLTVSLLPKSVTTPIATAIAEGQGGIVSITVAAVIFTGILGNLCAPALARLFRVKDPVAAGLAIGACSHAMGTARALELGETEGAMSGLAIGLCGLATTILALFFDVLV